MTAREIRGIPVIYIMVLSQIKSLIIKKLLWNKHECAPGETAGGYY
jgi:hypothetical protein